MKCLSKQILKEECKWFLLKWHRVVASESLIDGKTSQEFQIPVAFNFKSQLPVETIKFILQ